MVQFREETQDLETGALSRIRNEDVGGQSGAEDSQNDELLPRRAELFHDGKESREASASDADDAPGQPQQSAGVRKGRRPARTHAATKLAQTTWLRVDQQGNTQLVTTDKIKLTQKLGIQPRDLRLLDPQMASVSPPAILDRDRAIVVNLGNVKCIITLEYCLVVNPEDEMAALLVSELKAKLVNPWSVGKMVAYPGLSRLSDVNRQLQPARSTQAVFGLSFELKVLEVCLDTVVTAVDQEARELELIAVPSLDKLTRKIRQGDLERIRRVKNRLTRLMKRVETIKEVLEKFLQDDEDMHRLNLTAMELSRQATMRGNNLQDVLAMGGSPVANLSRATSRGASRTGSRTGSSSSSSSSGSSNSMDSQDEAEVAEVEMLLEAYQMHLDTTYNKLQTLEEFIQDTEDLVNTSLDTHRNRIISTDIVLTSIITTLGLCTTMSSLFGMNIETPFDNEDPAVFTQVTLAGASLGPFVLLAAFWVWAIKSRLLA